MKHKSSKRSNSHKHHGRKRLSISSSTVFDSTNISSKKIDLGTGTVHLNSHRPCLKPNTISKTQKALKRDLLRCSEQRPTLLGTQTLQPPRMHHGSQQAHTTGSASTERHQPARRRSLSVNSRTFYATIDRIGPWPDISISRLRSDGNELLRPLKNFRNLKNPRVFSPKYYAALNENTSKFKFYPSTRTYIDEYRKQKGYVLETKTILQMNSLQLSSSVHLQAKQNEHYPTLGEFSSGVADLFNGTAKDRVVLSRTDFSLTHNGLSKSANDLADYVSTPPSIPSGTKVYNESQHTNNFPVIPMRNGHVRSTRHPSHHSSPNQQTMTLPSVTNSSIHYLSSMNSVEKAYSDTKKTSKVYLIHGRHKKKHTQTQRIHSDSRTSSHSQDYNEFRPTDAPVATSSQISTAVVVYQLPRRPPPIPISQNGVK